MSFFCDLLNYLKLKDIKEDVLISFIPKKGVVIYGDLIIKNITENELTFFFKKEEIIIAGENLKIDMISKGEVVVSGKIKSVKYGE